MSASAQKVVYQDDYEIGYGAHSGSQLRCKVLLIDEQAHVLRVLRLNLDRHGYDADVARSSEKALLMVQENQYNVIIITSDLPDMSAQQLCELFEKKSEPDCPLMLVGTTGNDKWINSHSCVERLEKPVSLPWVVTRLNDAFGECSQ